MDVLRRKANAPAVFLVLGLIAGGLVGYDTRPAESAAIRLGPLNIEVQGQPRDQDKLNNDQKQHIAIVALIGGVIGLGFGFALQRGIKL